MDEELNTKLSFQTVAKLASGLLRADGHFVIGLILASSSVGIISILMPRLVVEAPFVMMVFERLIQLTTLYLLMKRWRERLLRKHTALPISALLSFFFIGVMLWGAMMAPLLGLAAMQSVSFIFLFVLGISGFIAYQWFTYQVPTILLGQKFSEAAPSAKLLTSRMNAFPIKAITSAGGISFFLYGVAFALYPDGRSLLANAIAQLSSGIFWVLGCYLVLSFGCLALSDKEWHEAQLDPYRVARFETLQKGGFNFVTQTLQSRGATMWMAVASLLLAANFFRSLETPPPPTIILEKVEVRDDTIEIGINLSDPEYFFRGTYPMNFALAGENRSPIAPLPATIIDTNTKEDRRNIVPGETSVLRLTMNFKADRSGKAITSLTDLYLWYKNVKIAKIDFAQPDAPLVN